MKQNIKTPDKKDIQILTKDGKEFKVPVEGSLGLLALGAVGIQAWRKKQREMNYINPNENVIAEKKEKKEDKKPDE